MARARNIKPGFFTNDVLAECSPLARLLFAGLWTITDREGRLEDRPKKIKAEILPYDDCNADALLSELQGKGFIVRYVVGASRYIQVVNFNKHQNPHMKESASEIPAPDEHQTSTVQAEERTERAGLNPSSLIPHPESPIPQPESVKVNTTVAAIAPTVRRRTDSADGAVEVFEYWQRTLNHPTAKLDAKRIKAIKGRLADGYTVGDLCQAIDGCKYDPFSQGKNDRQAVFDDIELICRDGPKVDKFRKIAERGPPSGRPANVQQTIDNLQAYLSEHEN